MQQSKKLLFFFSLFVGVSVLTLPSSAFTAEPISGYPCPDPPEGKIYAVFLFTDSAVTSHGEPSGGGKEGCVPVDGGTGSVSFNDLVAANIIDASYRAVSVQESYTFGECESSGLDNWTNQDGGGTPASQRSFELRKEKERQCSRLQPIGAPGLGAAYVNDQELRPFRYWFDGSGFINATDHYLYFRGFAQSKQSKIEDECFTSILSRFPDCTSADPACEQMVNQCIDEKNASTPSPTTTPDPRYGRPKYYTGPLPDCAFSKDGCRSVDDLLILVINIIDYVFKIIGTIAFGFFIYGGVTIILSFGNSEKVGHGKEIITAAIIGLVISFSAFLVIQYIIDVLGVASGFRGI